MTTTLTVEVAFDTYKPGDPVVVPDGVAQILLKSFPGRYAYASTGGGGGSSGSGSGIVTPSQPTSVTGCIGVPAASLAVTFGYAVDTTSLPNVLYKWSGTAWVAIITAGSTAPAPVLAALTLSVLTGTTGLLFSAAISGATAGSTLAATSSDGTALAITSGVLTGTFASAGSKQITLTETLAGATGSPKQTVLNVTIAAAAPVLQALTLSSLAATAGSIFNATISGKTSGSTLAATSSDGTALSISNGALSGTFAAAGTKTITLTETLAGATGSPKVTALSVVVTAAAPVLQALGLSLNTAVAGSAWTSAISGQTSGSTITATSSDGTALTVANGQVSGTFAAAGAPTVTLTETLAGATGSPKSTQLTVTVSAAAQGGSGTSGLQADFSNPANSGLAGAL